MMTRFLTFLLLITSLTLSSCAQAQSVKENERLDKIHNQIITDHPALTHVSAAEIKALLSQPDELLLLDVREAKEFAVSHIDGAQRIDPDISAEDFMRQYGDHVIGKTVILYCSVGRRSSNLGARVQASLMEAGAANVSNLEGGIFRWHNNHGPLSNASGQTENVHPYNRWWARLVARKDDIAYNAE